jgi:hypothetical protein
MARPFLSADWRDVVLVNFRVDPDLLRPYLPPGAVLDTPDGRPDLHLASLVAFTFANTRVRGVPLPGAQAFGEVNVRFYARRGPMRAAVFVREFVPVPLVVFGARLLYRQPYHLARISHDARRVAGIIEATTAFARGRVSGTIRIEADDAPEIPGRTREEHFLKEHYWGFDRGWTGRSFRYRVDHPVWRTFPVRSAAIGLDPGMLIGGDWAGIDWQAARHSVLFAEGSRAVVWGAQPLIEPDLIGLERGVRGAGSDG